MTNSRIFLNYATVSPINEAAYKASKKFLEDFHTIGPPEVLYRYEPFAEALAEEAAELLNCSPAEITTVKNTSEGIIIASEALPLDPEDEVLVLGNEYPANLLPWLKKRADNITVTVIEGTDNAAAFERLLDAIGPKSKAVSISSGQYYDGFMPDLQRLSRICRDKGIFLVVDAVQTIGIRPFDLDQIPADFLICGGQKFLGAGPGIGFMYVNKSIMDRLRPTKVGIRSMQSFTEQSYILKNTADRFQDGTQNLAGIVALHAALRDVNQRGLKTSESASTKLLGQIKTCLKDHGIEYIDHQNQQSNIVSMRVPNPQALAEYLKTESIYIKCIKDVARISFAPTSHIEDVQTLAQLTRQWQRSGGQPA